MSNRQVSVAAELHGRVKKLMGLHKLLQEDNMRIKAANEKLSRLVQELKEQLKKQQEINKALRLAQALGTEADGDQNTRDLKVRLNHYIQEIDRCLAMLHP